MTSASVGHLKRKFAIVKQREILSYKKAYYFEVPSDTRSTAEIDEYPPVLNVKTTH